MVQTYVPNAAVEIDGATEFTLLLPMDSSGAFQAMFIAIDEHKEDLKIRNYGVSVTTLEEVFIRCGMSGGDFKAHSHKRLVVRLIGQQCVARSIEQLIARVNGPLQH